jgi:hypothetical protein
MVSAAVVSSVALLFCVEVLLHAAIVVEKAIAANTGFQFFILIVVLLFYRLCYVNEQSKMRFVLLKCN